MRSGVKIGTAIILAAAGAFPVAAFGVSGKVIAAQVGGAAGFEVLDFVTLGIIGSVGRGPIGAYSGIAVAAAYPFAAAFGCDVGARNVGESAPNRREAIGYATLAAYGETALLGAVAFGIHAAFPDVEDVYMGDIYLGFFLFDVVTKPFLVTYVYNEVKKPAAALAENGRLSVQPMVAATRSADGGPLPIYGFTIGF